MSEEEARSELLRCSGTQFDPTVVSAFLIAASSLVAGSSSGPVAAAA
jgi:response regulator RpfG family c-di-GMP phosphodiesterase